MARTERKRNERRPGSEDTERGERTGAGRRDESNLPFCRPMLYDGSLGPSRPRRSLRAGPLELEFDPVDCGLHDVRHEKTVLLHSVVAAFRTANWATIPNQLTDYHLEEGMDDFALQVRALCRAGDVDFSWRGAVTGASDGTLTFTFDGEARARFLRNRVGLCVLHPAALSGVPVHVTHVDGTDEMSSFPVAISPQQPFLEIGSLAHEVAAGRWATVTFDGEVFEMEDQRNWTDASFKAYGTPLRLPFPVLLEAGTKVHQSVTLSLTGDWAGNGAVAPRVGRSWIALQMGHKPVGRMPRIGLGVGSHGEPLSQLEQTRLRAVHPSHLRVDLDLTADASRTVASEGEKCPGRRSPPSNAKWQEKLRRAAAEAKELGTALEVALHVSDHVDRELVRLRAELDLLQVPVTAWLVFHETELSTSERWVKVARRHLDSYEGAGMRPLWAAGSDTHFAQLNREHPPADQLDMAVYPISAQNHAFDTTSVAESATQHGLTVANARRFSGPCRIGVTPVTLRNRSTVGGLFTGQERAELPAQVDPRQLSLFGAAWTLASLQQLAASGAWSVTYYETTGWKGLMETEAGSPMPEAFPSAPGMVFPIYHVMADVGEYADAEVLPVNTDDASVVVALAMRKARRCRVLVANLTASTHCLRLTGLGAVRVRVLDETTAATALLEPERFRWQAGELVLPEEDALSLCLLPYAVARLDAMEPLGFRGSRPLRLGEGTGSP